MKDITNPEIEILTLKEAKEYGVVFSLFRGLLPYVSDEVIAKCVSITVGLCSSCYENSAGCQCWNDE